MSASMVAIGGAAWATGRAAGKGRPRACRASAFGPTVTPERGFLPDRDPLQRLGDPAFAAYESALDLLPKYAVGAGRGELRAWLEALPPFPTEALLPHSSGSEAAAAAGSIDASAELWRAYMLLSFLSHGFMWCDGTKPPAVLPARLAAPWCAVAGALDMPPVLVYSTYNLLNWRRLDPAQPVALGNICCLHNFLGGVDEEWFRLIHVAIEQQAAPAVAALPTAQAAGAAGDTGAVRQALEGAAAALRSMQATLDRMGEMCDPYVYYHRVRLPMSGWRSNPALPGGLVYEGQHGGRPQQLYGGTGAQSAALHALDAALGIEHEECSWLKAYLLDMRAHMPPPHRQFVAGLEAAPSLRAAVEAAGGRGELREAYNDCVQELERFRLQHKAFAFNYITKHNKAAEKGTGSSDFMPALQDYHDATSRSVLP